MTYLILYAINLTTFLPMQICLEWQKYKLVKKSKSNFLFIKESEQVLPRYSAIKKTGLPGLLAFIASLVLLLFVLILPNIKQVYLTQNFIKITILFFLAPLGTILQNPNMKRFAKSRLSNQKCIGLVRRKWNSLIQMRNKVVPITCISDGIV